MDQNKSIVKSFLSYTIPSVTGMLVAGLYVVIDGIFVGKGVGENALAAVNITYPFIVFQVAVTMLIAVGGANQFSFNKAREINDYANNAFLQSLYLIIGISFIMNIVVYLFSTEISTMLGANEILIPYVEPYLKCTALFGILYMPSLTLSIFVRNDNDPKLEMIGTLSGALINIVLDYYFIMVLGMGIAGAAIATGIGQIGSFLIFSLHFLRKDRVLKFTKVRWFPKEIKRIIINGTSSFLMEFSQSVVSFSFNIVLITKMGSIGVSAYGIVLYITSTFNLILIGVVRGSQPLMSYQFGKGNNSNIRKIYSIGIFSNILLSILFYILILLFGKNLIGLFINNNQVLNYTTNSMIIYYSLAFFSISISLMNILYFQTTGKEGISIIISILRTLGFIQVFLFILPKYFGTLGIYLSYPLGELLNCIISIVLYKKYKLDQVDEASIKELFRNRFKSIISI